MIEPASAVPSEAPRLVIVFCTPPTSGLSSSGTAETVTAPSCEASAPIPSPIRSIGTKTISGPASASSAAEQDDGAGEQREQAAADDEPRRDVREEARDADRGDEQRDRERQQPGAGLERRQAEARPRGRAARRRRSPPGRGTGRRTSSGRRSAAGCAASPGARAAPRPRDSRRASQRKKSQITNSPPRTSHTRRREPRPGRPVGLRLDPAPLARAEDAEDEQPEPERRQHGADHVEARALLGRRVGDPAGEEQDDEDDHDLAGEDPAPGEVRRAEAADQRADRDRDRARGRDQPVRGGPALGREVAGDERDDRGQDQRRADPLEERPAEAAAPAGSARATS